MAAADILLDVRGLAASYGKKQVLRGVTMALRSGEMVALIGHNGSAKTTTLKTVFGLVPPDGGTVRFRGADVTRQAAPEKVRRGMAFVPQGRGIFPSLTVAENLLVGGCTLGDDRLVRERVDEVTEFFPVLGQKLAAPAQSLSGGEQQMLALGIALVLRPELLLLDEPSVGLSPVMVQRLFDGIRQINASRGTTILVAEQNVKAVLKLVHRVYVLKLGEVVLETRPSEMSRFSVWELF